VERPRRTENGRGLLLDERGLLAFEVKRSSRVRAEDRRSLEAFLDDHGMARAWLVYTGTRAYREGRIEVVPFRRLPGRASGDTPWVGRRGGHDGSHPDR
jgi:hypothetical protein